MRLNLPRHNCIHFRIIGEFTASNDVDVDIQAFMDQTQTHTHDIDGEEILVAFFGSRSSIGGAIHRVRGSIERSVGEDDARSFSFLMTIDRALESLPRPPTTVRPVSLMMGALSRVPEPVEVTCNAVFEYETSAYQSIIRFPFPLMIQDAFSGVTHVEQAQFSRRLNDEIDYRISVTTGESSITHSVEFGATGQLDNRSLGRLLMRARSISLLLVMPSGEENDARN